MEYKVKTKNNNPYFGNFYFVTRLDSHISTFIPPFLFVTVFLVSFLVKIIFASCMGWGLNLFGWYDYDHWHDRWDGIGSAIDLSTINEMGIA